MILDAYYKRPLAYDYFIAISICIAFYYLSDRSIFSLPSDETNISTTTDLSTIALTIAGFILTLLTVLITFKSGAKISNSTQPIDNIPLFDLFFSTRLYFETTNLLTNAIKSLIFVAVIGFTLKLLLSGSAIKYLFFSNMTGLVIIVMSLLRSLLILNKIIDIQRNS